jgi:hypothetical protein
MSIEVSVPAWSRESSASGLAWVDLLLRDRAALLAAIEREDDLASLSRAMALTVIVAAGAFGAALGAQRGGIQILLAALKLPLGLLLTAAICTPSITAMRRVLLRTGSLRADAARVLASLALSSLVASALAPLVLLAVCAESGYHRVIVVGTMCGAIAGAAGLGLFARSLRDLETEVRRFLLVTALTTFGAVGMQGAWTLRPYVTRPKSPVVLVRPIQGNFLDAAVTSVESALGLMPPAEVER